MSVSDDNHHLQMLAIAHYVVAAVQALLGCFPLIYMAVGLVLLFNPPAVRQGEPPPELIGWILTAIGGTMTLFAWAFAAGILFAGLSIASRRRFTFCFAVAAVNCIFFPIGTALGVFTLIVLMRPSVKQQFEQGAIEEVSKNEDLWAQVEER